MKLSTNVPVLLRTYNMYEIVDICANAGFDYIEFPGERIYEEPREYYTELRKYAEDKGILFDQAHAPFASQLHDEPFYDELFEKVVKALKACSYLGVNYAVTHPCKVHHMCKDGETDKLIEYNLNYYRRFIPYYEEYGVKIAIENAGTYSVSKSPEEHKAFLDLLDNPAFVACVDVGHYNCFGFNCADGIRTVGEHVKCLHIHDNDGTKDMHKIPFTALGTIDWEDTMKALAEIDYKGSLNYEIGAFLRQFPAELHAAATDFTADIARYLRSRFEFYREELNK